MLFSFCKWTSYVKSYMNNLPKNSAYLLHLKREQNYKYKVITWFIQYRHTFAFLGMFWFSLFI